MKDEKFKSVVLQSDGGSNFDESITLQFNDDLTLKKLALEYVNETGAVYLLENDASEDISTTSMDRKIKIARRRQWFAAHRRTVVSVAASVVVLVVVGATLLPGFLRGDYSFTGDFAIPQADAPVAAPAMPPAPTASAPPPAHEAGTPAMEETEAEYNLWAEPEDEMFFRNVDDSTALPVEWAEREREPTINDDRQLNQQQLVPAPPAESPAPENDGIFDSWGIHTEESVEVEEDTSAGTGAASMPPSPEAAPTLPADEDAIMTALLPPTGWQTVYANIESEIVVYHFENTTGDLVSVTIAPWDNLDLAGFTPVQINETAAYLRVESSYSVLVYRQGGRQFTLTTTGDYGELINLAQYWN